MARPTNNEILLRTLLNQVADALAARLTGPAAPRGARSAVPAAARDSKFVRRSPQVLAALTRGLLAYVKANPGERIEQIARGVGETTKVLRLPAQKLLGSRRLKARGQRRGTRYFAA